MTLERRHVAAPSEHHELGVWDRAAIVTGKERGVSRSRDPATMSTGTSIDEQLLVTS